MALTLIGGGLIACGDDPAPKQAGAINGNGDGDAPGDGDGDGDGGEATCMSLAGTSLEVQACTTSDGKDGYKVCMDGVPSGVCMTQAQLADADGGALTNVCISLPMLDGQYARCEGGQTYQKCSDDAKPTGQCKTVSELIVDITDGGIPNLGDAGTTAPCPTSGGFMCTTTSVLGNEVIAEKSCTINSGVYTAPPRDPACTTTGAVCTTMGLRGNCITGLPVIGSVCAQRCP
ncbi:MAG: hypothetical protein QM778_18040 [Myxococcales bacterium]